MKQFTAIIKESNTSYELSVTINDKKQTGVLRYLNENYPLSTCMKSSVTGGLVFLMHIGQYIKLKARLYTTSNDGNTYLIFITGNTPHNYLVTEDEYLNFQVFDNNLQLPVSNIKLESGYSKLSIEWSAKQSKVHLSVFIGWMPPGDTDTAMFLNITINGQEADMSGAYYLPAKNGLVVPLGLYDQNYEYFIAWKCRAGYVAGGTRIIVGYFKNNNLNNREILDQKGDLNPYEEWENASCIKL